MRGSTDYSKGDKRRPYDRKGYDESKLWVNLEKKKQLKNKTNQAIIDLNK
jgi:hypothetical protein